jgi:hypothetical protein
MSDRKASAREIAARTKPRFIEIKPERRAYKATRFIEIPRVAPQRSFLHRGGNDRKTWRHDRRRVSLAPDPHLSQRIKEEEARTGGPDLLGSFWGEQCDGEGIHHTFILAPLQRSIKFYFLIIPIGKPYGPRAHLRQIWVAA